MSISAWEKATQELCHAMIPVHCSKAVPKHSSRRSQQISLKSSGCAEGGGDLKAEADAISEVSTDTPTTLSDGPGPDTPTSDVPVQEEHALKWTNIPSRKKNKSRGSELTPTSMSAKSHSQHAMTKDRPSARREAHPSIKGLPHFKRIEVGIDDDEHFRVVQRLIGPRGKHMQDITNESRGAKVWIIGKGSRSWDDSVGPLMICVGATSGPVFDCAVGLVKDLLDRVFEEKRRFRLRAPRT